MKINFEDKFLSHILKRGYDYFHYFKKRGI